MHACRRSLQHTKTETCARVERKEEMLHDRTHGEGNGHSQNRTERYEHLQGNLVRNAVLGDVIQDVTPKGCATK